MPIYPLGKPNQLEDHIRRHQYIFSNCKAAVIIAPSEVKPIARLLKIQVASLKRIGSVTELTSIQTKLNPQEIHASNLAPNQYTSGSTGTPKGVMLSHENLLANIHAMGETLQVNPSDIVVSWLPLYHDMGLIGAWLGSHRIDENELAGLDLSCLRAFMSTAEAVSPETLGRFIQRFEKFGFKKNALLPVYGLAQSSVGLCFPPVGRGLNTDSFDRKMYMENGKAVRVSTSDPKALRFVGSGFPMPGHQIRVVDSFQHELPE